jgi:general secretion pathway protein G
MGQCSFTLTKGTKMRSKSGFTLVEILIVVVILGILAAIVIPQFTNASTEAKENSLKADLQTLRSQIELYKIQHTDVLPGGGDPNQFVTDMTTASGGYGPYLQQMPANPFNSNSREILINALATAVDTTVGWHLNTATGQVHATSTGHIDW